MVARINPIRFSKSTEFDFDDVLGRMQKNAAKFNVERCVRKMSCARVGEVRPRTPTSERNGRTKASASRSRPHENI